MNKYIDDYLTKFNLKIHLNEKLINNMSIKIFNKDEYIYKLNEQVDFFYLLVEGRAKVMTLAANGRSLVLCLSTPLSVMGDLEFLNYSLADCNVIALEKCTCLAIPIAIVHEYGFNDCNFLRFIINTLGNKIRNNSTYSSINLLYPLENRLASYLLSLYYKNNKSPSFTIDSITNIADLLGTSYRHLNRVISKFIKEGAIIKNKRIICISNIEILKQLEVDLFKF